jgi:hypothetical protein
MDKEAVEKKEYIEHTEQLISFWQGKLDHDDANLIEPTARLLIQHTIQRLKKVNDILSLGYVQLDKDQSMPNENETNTWYKDDLGEAGRIGYRLGQKDMRNAGFKKVR